MSVETVVIGCGSLLRGDDAVGLLAVEILQKKALPPNVRLVASGLPGLGLLDLLAGYETALLVDAVLTDGPAGEVFELCLSELEGSATRFASVHDLALPEVLALGYLLKKEEMPQKLVIIGISVEQGSLVAGQPLSAQGLLGAEKAACLIAKKLAV
ncbi:MAG: hydrogenase maturation protease [Clostridium sp.]|nr:hydrogenase maturation protease [Clostridium sp.]